MPYFWIRGGDYADFETAVTDDPTVQNVTKLNEYEDGKLYRAEWTRNIESIVYAYLETGATILEATGRAHEWDLRMRFDDDRLVADFQDYCRRNDISSELTRLYHPSEPMAGGQYGLSPKQRTALVTGLESRYFDVPRSVSMEDLADELDISQQSLSKLLRRAHRNMIERSDGEPSRGLNLDVGSTSRTGGTPHQIRTTGIAPEDERHPVARLLAERRHRPRLERGTPRAGRVLECDDDALGFRRGGPSRGWSATLSAAGWPPSGGSVVEPAPDAPSVVPSSLAIPSVVASIVASDPKGPRQPARPPIAAAPPVASRRRLAHRRGSPSDM
jgi:predicted DNA binding protein